MEEERVDGRRREHGRFGFLLGEIIYVVFSSRNNVSGISIE